MTEEVSEEQLWSWVDREAPELEGYLAQHPEARGRVDELRGTIGKLALAESAGRVPERIGGFRVKGLLGRGGMGCVYDAEQDDPRRAVALKVLPPDVATDERRLALFRREANALARLSHAGIATVFEVGRGAGEVPFIAMERVDGLPLHRYVEEHRPGQRECVLLGLRIAEAVGHAHEQGVVHRDLKPTNILVQPDGTPKVVDFGLARILADDATRFTRSEDGTLVGTLPYMSPEQVRGLADDLGPASDVYSLGVVLYQLLTGELPYDLKGLALPEAARRICEVAPARARGKLRGDVETIIFKALEKRPSDRFEAAGALAADLRRFLDGRPVDAARPSPSIRVLRFYRRHWLGTTLASTVLLLCFFFLFPAQTPIPIGSGWWRKASPFDGLRWRRDQPEVLVDGRWYELVAIEDLDAAYIVGFCKQHSDSWRKRFSEDLVQVLNRMGDWSWFDVDLTLRDPIARHAFVLEDVRMTEAQRRRIVNDRHTWPFQLARNTDSIEFQGREWILRSVDGLDLERARGTLYDSVCEELGRSPADSIELELEDPETGERASVTMDRKERE